MPSWVGFAILVVVGPAWMGAGRVAQRLKTPQITGFVLGGLLCGPSFLNLLTPDILEGLVAVDQGCLSIIALSAGAEVMFGDLRRIKRQVVAITLGVSICTFSCVFLAMMGLAPHLQLLSSMTVPRMHVVAALAGTMMIARSPATAVAVLRETDGKGPYCSLVMAVVVVKDVVVFLCFAINIEFVRVVMKADAGLSPVGVLKPFLSLGISMALGCGSGVGLSLLLHWRPSSQRALAGLSRRIGSAISAQLKTLSIATLAMCLFWLAEQLGGEPLLSCVLAGIVLTNRKGEVGSQGSHEELSSSLKPVMPVINMAFFGLAGASVRLRPLVATLWASFAIFLVRLVAVFMGSWLGAFVGGTPSEHRRRIWQGMVTQAGIALGLAKTVALRFPSWGPDFAALMVAVILMNLLAGPPLFRAAVIAAGEARALVASDLPLMSPHQQRHGTKHSDVPSKAGDSVMARSPSFSSTSHADV